ncbi:class I SAM-dependent methyltransferase [Cysteiniphilum litorale]|uniref:class I SAM-dependent methyltransferase n=1 Tax=Cysteiniphilum litorale TaxID=2056700 RepID=UPI003F8834F2
MTTQWDVKRYTTQHNFVTNYGYEVVELLAPQQNEVILDLGCGNGELSYEISKRSHKVCGIDFAQSMVEQANKDYPHIDFTQHNAELAFPFAKESFDAVFSNAALHWMHNADAVIKNIKEVLKPNGRFVFEMGGKGNVNNVLTAIETAAQAYGVTKFSAFNFYPSIAEYATLLENNGFRVTFAVHFDRPTLLQTDEGLCNWVKMFRNDVLSQIPNDSHEDYLSEVESLAKGTQYQNAQWYADYVRLRMVAIKLK